MTTALIEGGGGSDSSDSVGGALAGLIPSDDSTGSGSTDTDGSENNPVPMVDEDTLDWDEFYRSWGLDDQADAIEQTQEDLGLSDEFWQAGAEDANDSLPEQVGEDLSDWEGQAVRNAERNLNNAGEAVAGAISDLLAGPLRILLILFGLYLLVESGALDSTEG
ncbi:hypothetical protein [Salinirussus salinus]|uniref:hypothetical protein n=1 Tax=Salinirussus salinus TaxID=1198300 RepID=UPI0013590585|nr:hypothetical protein [Salinirussus salinus]